MDKQKLTVFFGDKGLTSASADHLSNIAVQMATEIKSKMDSVRFVGESVKLLASGNSEVLSRGTSPLQLDNIINCIDEYTELYALVSWLREAVKARAALSTGVDNVRMEDWARDNGIEIPEKPLSVVDAPQRPVAPKYLTQDDILDHVNIKERAHLLCLQSRVAHIGKFIHEGGAFDKARSELMRRVAFPNEKSGSGSEMVIHSYIPSMESGEVESQYFMLQTKHRQYQAALNGLASVINERINGINEEMRRKYENDLEAYRKADDEHTARFEKAMRDYNTEMEKVRLAFKAWQDDERDRIKHLGIVIPNMLHGIYEKVNAVATSKVKE